MSGNNNSEKNSQTVMGAVLSRGNTGNIVNESK